MDSIFKSIGIYSIAGGLIAASSSLNASIESHGTPEYSAVGYISGETFYRKEITYDVIDGLAVFEGDIVLGTAEELKATTTGEKPDGILISGSQYRWPAGLVNYYIEPTLPSSTKSKIAAAINHWESNTPYRFVEINLTNYQILSDYIFFLPGSGCSATVGRAGGAQGVWLSTGCSTGNTIHEIGHAIGFWHEHSRENRNSYVQINFANIQPGREHNFNQHITDGDDVGNYDYGSIMHYGAYAFSSNGSPTIVPTNPSGATIGQRINLSSLDIATANTISGWQKVSGKLKQVSVGFGGEVWGVNANNSVYKYNGSNGWELKPGKLKQVSVGDNGVVWGVNNSDEIFKYNSGNNSWIKVTGSLTQIDVGSGSNNVWGLNSNGDIFNYNMGTWVKVPGNLSQISAGGMNDVWGINQSGKVFQYDSSNNSWIRIPGNLKQVEVGSTGMVWGINNSNSIYRYDYDNTWTKASGSLDQLSVGPLGNVWGVNNSNSVFRTR